MPTGATGTSGAYTQAEPDRSAVQGDSAVGHARRARPKKEAAPVLGRNRGGFRAQIHILVDQRDRPLRQRVTSGPHLDNLGRIDIEFRTES